jgi:hypothetical protein
LDEWVAEEVMGWEKGSISTDPASLLPTSWGTIREDGTWHPIRHLPWSPSTSILSAWEVVEHLLDKGYVFTLSLGTFHNAGFYNIFEGKGEASTTYEKDKLGCLAICRAAIKAYADGHPA